MQSVIHRPVTINVARLIKKNWKCSDDLTIKLFSLQMFSRCCKYFESTGFTPGAGLPLAGYLRVAIYPFIHGLGDEKRDLVTSSAQAAC